MFSEPQGHESESNEGTMTTKRYSGVLSRREFLSTSLAATIGLIASCRPPFPSPTGEVAESETPLDSTPAGAIYADPSYCIQERVDDLVSRMSVEEKISQMGSTAPAIERLGIPEYNWWNEALHGVGRAGIATVFPQAIGLASTWNADLIHRMAEVISDEGRAKHHDAARRGRREVYTGLTFWSPNINIFRDPRWGRGQETYGEDPHLTSRLGVSFVQGLQGDDPRYLKTVATPKHFAVHSGPEASRHRFDAVVSQRDLQMTYLPAFKACITEAKAHSIMGAYNRVNGEACCASPTLLQETLRDEWGFEGYVVSDCGAISDIYQYHRLAGSSAHAAAMAVKAGCDLECCATYGIPCEYTDIGKAIEQGLLAEEDLDRSVKRLFTARFLLGMFDPPDQVPHTQIPSDVVDSTEHRELALEVARQSLVLLKNEDNLLPVDVDTLNSIAVIGPNADETLVLSGNYFGTASDPVSVLAGVSDLVTRGTKVNYARGCEILGGSRAGFEEAVEAARDSELAVVVAGLSQQMEGEMGQQEGNPPGVYSLGDRRTLDLPGVQEQLLQAVYETGTPVVMVLMNGSALSVNWAAEHVPAILEAWYPGQAGGTAVAEALFGLTNPGGRLPVTFYRSAEDLPPFDDYSMENRTYRYFAGRPLYPFGYGLSYTTFAYRNLQIVPEVACLGESVSVQVEVENTGQCLGDEVVQLYLKDVEASWPVPQLQLHGFSRIRLTPGEKRTVQFSLSAEQMSLVNDSGEWLQEPGLFKVWVGGQQPGQETDQGLPSVLEGEFLVE
jgi:beta-glucosidase